MYLSLLFASTVFQHIQAETFISMAAMEHVVVSEKQMMMELENYILAEEKKLHDIKKIMSPVNDVLHNVNSSEEIRKYLGNPVNSYLMLRRFNVDWMNLEKILQTDLSESLNTVFKKLRPIFPTSEDHIGAMDAMFRLQTTYDLPSSSLARGVIPGVAQRSTQPLDIQDILDLGMYAYGKEEWPLAVQWLSTALDHLNSNYSGRNIDKSDVLDYLTIALFNIGNTRKAYKLTMELAKLRPHDNRIAHNLAFYKQEILSFERSKRGELGGESIRIDETAKEVDERTIMMKKYEKLCRGETRNLTKKEQKRLKCWYRHNNPVLRLKPQKVERVWVRPEIFLFPDIISEKQSQWIKETAYPNLQRATIQHPITGELTHAPYRVASSAWLSPETYLEVKKLRTRAEAVTGLDIKCAEDLQIANYGFAGQYEPHFDHAREEEDAFTELNMGNRIATLLFYISDVTAGGATVFTETQGAVYPVKNAAVFWYNLKRNGKGNKITKHAGCPVLVGQNWVSNWWVHEYGQVFRRPCALNRNW